MAPKKLNKVCLLACVFWPVYPGFGGRHAYVLAQNLLRAGYDVDVVAAFPVDLRRRGNFFRQRPLAIEMVDGLRVIRVFTLLPTGPGLWRKLLFYLSFALTSLLAIPIVRGSRFVLGLHPPPAFQVFPGFVFSKLLRAKYVIRITDLWPDVVFDFELSNSSVFARFVTLLTKVMYRFADHIMAFTPQIKDRLIQQGVPESKMSMIEMAVDADVFRPMPGVRERCVELGLPDPAGRFVVLYAGAFALTYDFSVFLEAARGLREEDVTFVILGDGDAKAGICAKIEEHGLKNVFMPRPVSGADSVAKYVNYSDVCVIPLKPEMVASTLTRPSKLFEFWACGKPVICCAKGELENLMQESDAGIAVEPGNTGALVQAIKRLRDDRELARTMGQNGRDFTLRRFSYDALGANLKGMFERDIL